MNKDFRKTIKFKKKIKKGLFSFFVDILQLPHTVILNSEKLTLPTGDSGSRRENFSNKNRKKGLDPDLELGKFKAGSGSGINHSGSTTLVCCENSVLYL